MQWSDGLSNDPCIAVGVSSLPERATIIWKDSVGNDFSAKTP